MKIKKIRTIHLIEEIKKLKNLRRLITITVLENKKNFTLLYQFDGITIINLELEISKKRAFVDSIITIFPSANIYECEIHDLFGIEFKGNPNLDHKLFLTDDWKEKPPLQKKGG